MVYRDFSSWTVTIRLSHQKRCANLAVTMELDDANLTPPHEVYIVDTRRFRGKRLENERWQTPISIWTSIARRRTWWLCFPPREIGYNAERIGFVILYTTRVYTTAGTWQSAAPYCVFWWFLAVSTTSNSLSVWALRRCVFFSGSK